MAIRPGSGAHGTQSFGYDPPTALAHLRNADGILRSLIERVGDFALQLYPERSLLEAMLRSIIYQQLHGKAAAAIYARVRTMLESCGDVSPLAIDRTSDEALRSAGLSRAKLLAVRDLAAKCHEGTIPTLAEARRMSDEDLIARLTRVRGIGPWTVHMLLIFHLGRADVMPTGDFAIRLAFRRLYGKRKDPTPRVILRHARLWQPYRSIASWYLWRSLDPAVGAAKIAPLPQPGAR